MKKNFHLDELEAFLSDSADQQRMYPSDRVWRNIDKELHGQKKWPALTFGALLTGAIITAGLILIHPDKNLLQVDPNSLGKGSREQVNASSSANIQEESSTPVSTNDQALLNAAPQPATSNNAVAFNDFNSYTQNTRSANAGIENNLLATNDLNTGMSQEWVPLNGFGHTGHEVTPNAGLTIEPTNTVNTDLEGLSADLIQNEPVASKEPAKAVEDNQPLQLDKNAKKSKWGIEYYFTPSYSYRYLTESKIGDFHQNQQAGPIAPNLINPVNNFVNHKPTLGLEAGAAVVYQATNKLRLSAGLQMNMRGYTIEAFASGIEPSTIVLNRGYYTDSIFALSTYSTQSGYSEANIMNRYWQVAVPIGLQYQVTNGKKVNLSIAASIQPTYQFSKSEYILSHDYRNYLQQPDLVKRWNVNTAIGAIISYEAAGVNWQIGPQIRYQAGSGTVKEYPIKEHLIDYGLKIGVVKTLK